MVAMEEDGDVMGVAGMQVDDDEEDDDYDEDEYNSDDLSIPPPPDGGFGWVIVVASLFCNIIVDGVCFSFGIFNVAFIEHYGSSKGKMAWVGSLLCGFYLAMGPITSTLCNRYGCRIVTVVGSFLCAISFFISTFATSVNLLILTYGVMGGITFGLVYLPAIVIVGLWFEKRRALATGLAVCGSGIGAFLFAPLSRYLLNEFGVRGANWIIAGIILHGCVFGALFRPVEEAYKAKRQPSDYIDEEEENVSGLLRRMALQKRDRKITLHGDEDIISSTGEYFIPLGPEGGGFRTPRPGIPPNRSFTSQRSYGSRSGSRPSLQLGSSRRGSSRPISLLQKSNKSLDQPHGASTISKPNTRPPSSLALTETNKRLKISEVDISKTHNAFEPKRSNVIIDKFKNDNNINNNSSKNSKNNCDFSGNPWGTNSAISQAGAAEVRNVKRKDSSDVTSRRELFFAGSLNQIPYIGSRGDIKSNIASMHSLHHAASRPDGINSQAHPGCRGLLSNAFNTFFIMMDFSLLKSPVFSLLCFSSFFSMTGFFVPFFYLPSYTADIGIPRSQGDIVIQMIGVANTVARIASGYLADLSCVDSLSLNNVALITGGVATMLVPFLRTTISLSIYGFVFGSCLAVFVSLRTPILAELLGRERLASSFGLFILFQGLATIIGSPIAGMVYDQTLTYDATFYFAGGIIAISGILLLPIRCVQRFEKGMEKDEPISSSETAMASSAASSGKIGGISRAASDIPDIVLEEPTTVGEVEKLEDNEAVQELLNKK